LKKLTPRPPRQKTRISSILGNVNSNNNAFAKRYRTSTILSTALPRAGPRKHPRPIPKGRRVNPKPSGIQLLESILKPGPENAPSK